MTTEFAEEDDFEWHLSLARLNMKNTTLAFLDPSSHDRTSNSKYVPSNVFTKRRHSFFLTKTVSMSSSNLDK